MAEGPTFSAGADISEMASMTKGEAVSTDFTGTSRVLATISAPVIAGVRGHARGGACEIVEMCDIVVAGRSAVFGHPEVSVGTMPGAGGTQRLPRRVSPALAADMLLTGRILTAEEALKAGLITRVINNDMVESAAKQVAERVASYSGYVVQCIKEALQAASELPLSRGLQLERKLFHATFDLVDRREGMRAFLERRGSEFGHH